MRRKRFLGLGLLLLLAGGTMVFAASTKVFYTRPGDEGVDIWKMDENGANQTEVLNDDNNNLEPALCGGKVVYASDKDGDYDIWIMASDGTGATNLTGSGSSGNDRNPDCSSGITPTVVFVSDKDDDDGEIYKISSAGGSITRLTDNSVYNGDPSWCGSSRIAYIEYTSGGTRPNEDNTSGDNILFMKTDGSDVIAQTCSEWVHKDLQCSADGEEVLFSASDYIGEPVNYEVWRNDICSDPDETYCCFDAGYTQGLKLTANSAKDDKPAWSTGEQTVFFRSDRGSSDDIWSVDADGLGGNLENRTNTSSVDEDDPHAGEAKKN